MKYLRWVVVYGEVDFGMGASMFAAGDRTNAEAWIWALRTHESAGPEHQASCWVCFCFDSPVFMPRNMWITLISCCGLRVLRNGYSCNGCIQDPLPDGIHARRMFEPGENNHVRGRGPAGLCLRKRL